MHLRDLVATGRFATAHLWPPLQIAQRWVRRTAQLLANAAGTDGATVAATYRAVLMNVLAHQTDPVLAPWATHFYTVTMRYWSGLFCC